VPEDDELLAPADPDFSPADDSPDDSPDFPDFPDDSPDLPGFPDDSPDLLEDSPDLPDDDSPPDDSLPDDPLPESADAGPEPLALAAFAATSAPAFRLSVR
jgi:hypothetical protein